MRRPRTTMEARGGTSRSVQVLIGGIFLLAVGACFSPLSITGAKCPCPAGYCCAPDDTCIRGSGCSATGGDDAAPDSVANGGNPPDGGDVVSEVGDPVTDRGEYVRTRIAVGDEFVVGFLPSGASLVTIGHPDTPSHGDLIVHRLDKGTVEDSGTIVSWVKFSNQGDVLFTDSFLWAPDLGFSKGTSPLVSPDGSLYATFDSAPFEPQTRASSISIFSTHSGSVPRSPIATIPLGETFYGADFSPDGRFLFVLDEAMPDPLGNKVRRISLKGTVGTVDTAAVTRWPFNFDSLGDAYWASVPDGVFRWRAGSSRPAQIAFFDQGDVLTDLGGDGVYVDAGGNPPTHTDRISVLTGLREPVSQDKPMRYLATSPNGSFALMLARDGVRVVALDTNWISASLYSCPDPLSEVSGVASELAFTPDSAFVMGGWYSCTVSGHPFPFADVVSVDVSGGQVSTLAAQSYGPRPFYLGAGRFVFLRPLPNADVTLSPAIAKSDLMLAYADGRPTELLAHGVDTYYVAVNGQTIAYSFHGDPATEGVYTLTRLWP